jgi:hypothetical protein
LDPDLIGSLDLDPDPDPEGQKLPTKIEKRAGCSLLRAEAFSCTVAWAPFMEAWVSKYTSLSILMAKTIFAF